MSSTDGAGTTVRWRLAIGDLSADRTRTVLAVASLAPLVVAYFVLAAVAQGLLVIAGEAPIANNVLVISANALDPMTGQLDDDDLTVAAEAAGRDLVRASGLLMRASEVGGRILQLRAAPPETFTPVHGLELVRGEWPDADDELIVTDGVIAATGWDVGDRAEIYGTTFRIAGIVSAPGTKFASMWLPLDRAQRLFSTPGAYQMVVLTLAPGADATAVIDRVEAAPELHDRAIGVREAAFTGEAARLVRFASWLGYVAATLAVVALAFGVFNLATVTLLERAREIGVLRVIGFAPAAVRGVLGARSVVIGLLAYVLGLAVAAPIVAATPVVVLRSLTLRIALTPLTVVAGAVLVGAVSWLGAVVAARRSLGRPARELVAAVR